MYTLMLLLRNNWQHIFNNIDFSFLYKTKNNISFLFYTNYTKLKPCGATSTAVLWSREYRLFSWCNWGLKLMVVLGNSPDAAMLQIKTFWYAILVPWQPDSGTKICCYDVTIATSDVMITTIVWWWWLALVSSWEQAITDVHKFISHYETEWISGLIKWVTTCYCHWFSNRIILASGEKND